jgi:hypothetical protein
MPKVETDYSQTIIYKICCKDHNIADIYIGHTTNFTQRKNSHKTSCSNENDKKYNQYVYEFIRNNGGWENWTMLQIENINCKDKREAEATEHHWIESLQATLNSNKPYAKCKEEPKLYKQIWYEEKKDYILEKAKEYYEENKDKLLEQTKQWKEDNPVRVTEQRKEYFEKNKDKINEYRRRKYAEKKASTHTHQ